MSLTDENPTPQQPAPEPIQEPIQLPPLRRRRRRYLIAPGEDERAVMLENLARRAFPSLEFFIFSLLCGAVLGAGYILGAQSILLLGALISPLMTPWVGLTLASITGSGRFYLQTLGGLIIGSAMVFTGGLLAGLASRIWLPLPLEQAHINSHFWWPNLVVLMLGAVLLVISFVRSEEKPILPSVMLSYALFLPLSAAAFGLGCGLPDVWPSGLLVFLTHLALATFLGILTLTFLHFHPASSTGYALAILTLLLTIIVSLGLSGIGKYIPAIPRKAPLPSPPPTFTPTVAFTITPVPQRTATSIKTINTITPSPTQPTLTPTLRIPPSVTPTRTITPQPTPVYARIFSVEGGGANVRSQPGPEGVVLKSLMNDYLVEVLPEVQTYNGVVWVHIRTSDGTVGWVMQMVLVFATPIPNWQPTATP